MDVKIERQRLAVAPAISRPEGGPQQSARGASEPRAQTRSPSTPAPDASEGSGRAWFDANGDGVIESWSIAHGGDSFANFAPPPSGSAPTEPSKSRRADPASAASTRTQPASGTGTAAAFSHAHAAYQRDGLAHAPGSHDAGAPSGDAPTTAPVSAPPAAAIALRSTAS